MHMLKRFYSETFITVPEKKYTFRVKTLSEIYAFFKIKTKKRMF